MLNSLPTANCAVPIFSKGVGCVVDMVAGPLYCSLTRRYCGMKESLRVLSTHGEYDLFCDSHGNDNDSDHGSDNEFDDSNENNFDHRNQDDNFHFECVPPHEDTIAKKPSLKPAH